MAQAKQTDEASQGVQIALLSLNSLAVILSFAKLYANSFSRTFNPPPSWIATEAFVSLQFGSCLQETLQALSPAASSHELKGSETWAGAATLCKAGVEKADGSGNPNFFPPFFTYKHNHLKNTMSFLLLCL